MGERSLVKNLRGPGVGGPATEGEKLGSREEMGEEPEKEEGGDKGRRTTAGIRSHN